MQVQFGEAERGVIYDAAKEKRWIRAVGDLRRENQRLQLLNPCDGAVIDTAEADRA